MFLNHIFGCSLSLAQLELYWIRGIIVVPEAIKFLVFFTGMSSCHFYELEIFDLIELFI